MKNIEDQSRGIAIARQAFRAVSGLLHGAGEWFYPDSAGSLAEVKSAVAPVDPLAVARSQEIAGKIIGQKQENILHAAITLAILGGQEAVERNNPQALKLEMQIQKDITVLGDLGIAENQAMRLAQGAIARTEAVGKAALPYLVNTIGVDKFTECVVNGVDPSVLAQACLSELISQQVKK